MAQPYYPLTLASAKIELLKKTLDACGLDPNDPASKCDPAVATDSGLAQRFEDKVVWLARDAHSKLDTTGVESLDINLTTIRPVFDEDYEYTSLIFDPLDFPSSIRELFGPVNDGDDYIKNSALNIIFSQCCQDIIQLAKYTSDQDGEQITVDRIDQIMASITGVHIERK